MSQNRDNNRDQNERHSSNQQSAPSNLSIYSSSSSNASSAQSSSLFSRGNTSTVPSSAFSTRSTKIHPSSNLLRIPDNSEYEPAHPSFQNHPLQQQQPQQQQQFQSLSSSPSNLAQLNLQPSSSSFNQPFQPSNPPSRLPRYQNSQTPTNISSDSTSPTIQPIPTTSSTSNSRSIRQFPPISQESLSFSASNPSLNLSINPPPPPPPPPPPIGPDIDSHASQPASLSVVNVLQRLAENLTSSQVRASTRQGGGLLRIALEIDQNMKQALTSSSLQHVSKGSISVFREPSLATIICVSLHFIDNYFSEPSLSTRRAILLRQLFELGVLLKILEPIQTALPQPAIFAMGAAPEEIPGLDKIVTVLELMTHHRSEATMDQDGAFIAPVLRGFHPAFAVPTYYFGYPKLILEHRKSMISLSESFGNDAHFFCAENYIRAASLSANAMESSQLLSKPNPITTQVSPISPSFSSPQTADFNGFMAPFRVPKDPLSPPISMSISTDSMTSNVSGTLGGYIYPKVDPSNKDLADYSKSTYALTCAHVCLVGDDCYPRVTIPSTFMINVFRRLLMKERNRYVPGTTEYQTYSKALDEVHSRLLPAGKLAHAFGQVTWGEREIVNGQLSDLAIIKCDEKVTCRNTLGDDIYFTQYDPGLRFGGLDVKTVVRTLRPGMNVFKYGSTTKYTTGQLNGPKIVYWSEGKLQSSEFVVASGGPFANGGDSGAWILHKNVDDTELPLSPGFDSMAGQPVDAVEGAELGNYASSKKVEPSLGVVGMLHSYDGERREFGLFTPIGSVLERLKEVTGIPWGVVGITEKGDEETTGPGNSDTSDEENDGNHHDNGVY